MRDEISRDDHQEANRPVSGIGLRPLLQTILVAIVVPAAGIVAALANYEARNALSDLPESQFRSTAQGTTPHPALSISTCEMPSSS